MDARTVRAQTAATGSASYPNGGLPGLEPGEHTDKPAGYASGQASHTRPCTEGEPSPGGSHASAVCGDADGDADGDESDDEWLRSTNEEWLRDMNEEFVLREAWSELKRRREASESAGRRVAGRAQP